MTDGEDTEDVTVYVSEKAGTYGSKTYHTDPDCQYLGNANGVRDKSLSVLNGHYEKCSVCPDLADGGQDPEDAPTFREELQVVLSSGEDSAICNGAYTALDSALNAATAIGGETHVQSITLDRTERVSVDGREFLFREYPRRHPRESHQVEVVPDVDVKQGLYDARRWRYVFKITDWTDNPRLDEDGIHATLQSIYAPADDAPSAGPDGYATVAVNGGTRVPEFIRNALMSHLEIEGFGRPPFIPERDGEPVESEPVAVATDGGSK